MSDLRNFAKIDLGYFDNPKISEFVDERPRVPMLHLRAILYCRQHLTDGTFPLRAVVRLACATYCGEQCEGQCDVCAAIDAGLFERVDERTGLVHDYLEHQDSAEQAARRRAAGQKGAAVRWAKDAKAPSNANGIADGTADGNAERGEERRGDLPGRKRPKTAIPEDWKPTTSHETYATERKLDLSTEAFRFRNHAIQVDRRCVNWNSAFTNWLSNAKPAPKAAGREGWWS